MAEAKKESRAERLDRLVRTIVPGLKDKEGWGPGKAPYAFSTLEDGRQKLTVEDPESGERIGVVGNSRDELLDKLEERVKGRT
jgi:hypothetical protein